MAIPGTPEPLKSRVLSEYTIGTQETKPSFPAAAAPGTSSSNPPSYLVLVGVGYQTGSIAVGAQSSGNEVTVTLSLGLPQIEPYLARPGREVRGVPMVAISSNILGLVLRSLDYQPQAIVGGGTTITGSIIPAGQTYQTWTVIITAIFRAAIATLAGSVTARAWLALYDAPLSTGTS